MRNEEDLFITHLFDASQAIVFNAWTDPEQLKIWYAPDGCTIEFKSIEVKEGGHFHSCIHDPVYGQCWIIGEYLEVIPPQKLVFTMVLSDESGRTATPAEAGKSEDWPAAIVTTVTLAPLASKPK